MPEAKFVWDVPTPVPERLIQHVDPAVLNSLPPGTQVQGIYKDGKSYWAMTAKITATDINGNDSAFFLKVLQFDQGKDMVSAEFKGMKELHSVMPEMVAEPIAWGSYTSEPDAHFFVARFFDLRKDELPHHDTLAPMVAEMHRRGTSPAGQFGYPITMYGGKNPQSFPMSSSWEECFTKGMEKLFDAEEETMGYDDEIRRLRGVIMTKVIPRLLRPLETDGRSITPVLVHGDLWDGNAGVDTATGRPVIFDATPLYAHHEYDLGPWFVPRISMTQDYVAAYIKVNQPSEPACDFEDRGLLYSLRFDVHSSSLYKGNSYHRGIVRNSMRRLAENFSSGFAGYLDEKKD